MIPLNTSSPSRDIKLLENVTFYSKVIGPEGLGGELTGRRWYMYSTIRTEGDNEGTNDGQIPAARYTEIRQRPEPERRTLNRQLQTQMIIWMLAHRWPDGPCGDRERLFCRSEQ
jgi:hypothetical protein